MCKWGTDIFLWVPIPAELSYTGEFRWDYKGIDSCIAPLVQALNDAKIYTANSCCGHEKSDGQILLHDGRKIIIKNKKGGKKESMEGLIEGRIVHFVMSSKEHRPAIVVKVWHAGNCIGYANLVVFVDGSNDVKPAHPTTTTLWETSICFNNTDKPVGTWHWIEKV